MTPTPYGPRPTTHQPYGAAPYGANAPAAPPPAPGRTALRVLVAVVLVAVGTVLAAVAALLGVITSTGCFLQCDASGGQPVLGALLVAAALGLLVAGPVLARVMWTRTRTRPVTGWALVVLGLAALGLGPQLGLLLPWF